MPFIRLVVRWLDAGEGSGQVKNYFLYTGSVVRVSASSSFIAVNCLNANPQSLGPTSKLFFSVDKFFGCLIMCVLFSPFSGTDVICEE